MNSEALQLKIVSADGILLDTSVESVRLPSTDGSIGIRKGHTNAVIQLVAGEVYYRKDGKDVSFVLEHGAFCGVRDNEIILITE